MSTCWPRTASSKPICSQASGCPVPGEPRSPKSANGWGRKLLQQVASVANPDTILGWYRQLVAAKFDGSRQRRLPGRPRIAAEIERLVVRLARENSGWGMTGSWER
jgi:hypothetical protein